MSSCPVRAILVGTNASRAAENPEEAFSLDTVSGKRLHEIVSGIEAELFYTNVYNSSTQNNKPLTTKQVYDSLPELYNKIKEYDKVIAVGRTADRALTLLNIPHITIPHPSGINRFWNNQDSMPTVKEMIRKYLEDKHE